MKKPTITKLLILLTTIFMLSASFMGVDAAAIQNKKAQEDIQSTIDSAFDYLKTQINQDGGVRWMDDTSSVPTTIRTVLALAGHHFPQDYLSASSGQLPIDFLSNSGGAWVNQRESESPSFNVARAGQLLTAIAAANENPRRFGKDPVDYIKEINNQYDLTTGIYGTATEENVTDQVWAILGLAANHASIPADTANWLARAQNDDGSWDDGFGGFLDITPLAIMALIASDHTSAGLPEIQNAIDFLENNQQNNGGWQTQWDSTTNANTTGMILQAIASIGQNPRDEEWKKNGENPLTALSALQKENGMIGGEYANAYSTTEALLGLSGEPLYSLGYLTRSHQAFTYI
ncbi:MAG: hypothetical protein SVP52_08235, partial [Chloroflexota bacterium]|nr:hypothetical protein [Chloroflexota bacterium]